MDFPKQVASRVNLHSEEMKAAIDFVASVEEGLPITVDTLAVLRNALARIIDGEEPSTVFRNKPSRGRPKEHDRDWLVALYIESRKRELERQGMTRGAIEAAKEAAANAFPWPESMDEQSCIDAAWKRYRTEFKHYSDEFVTRLLGYFRGGKDSEYSP